VEPEVEVADEPTGKRIGIQLDADGRIAWDRLRASTRDELKNMIADPRLAEELGSAPRVNGDALDPSTVGMLYGALGSLMVGAAKAMGYPEDQALSMQFTADERDALLTPTSKVLQKYTGALGAWEDEIMLSFALGSILIAKVSALKKPAKVIKMAERTSSPAPDPDPVTM
jgi:hypothetical protein